MNTLFKYIVAFLMFITVCAIILIPFKFIIDGFILAASGSIIWSLLMVVIGCILFRLIKPISIITGKDYKIF